MADAAAINQSCPWSGKPVQPDSLTHYRGQTVGFCNPGCRDKFVTAVAQFDAAIETTAGPTLLNLVGAAAVPARLASRTSASRSGSGSISVSGETSRARKPR